jgi:hypothetical protein
MGTRPASGRTRYDRSGGNVLLDLGLSPEISHANDLNEKVPLACNASELRHLCR